MTLYREIIEEIKSLKNPKEAEHSMRFFKTGKGEYGEGDLFLGLTTPQLRIICKKYYPDTSLEVIEKLLQDKYHDIRMAALNMLVHRFEKDLGARTLWLFTLEMYNTLTTGTL